MSAVVNQPDVFYRKAGMSDIAAIMEVETSVYDFPWTKQIFNDCVRAGYQCEVGEIDGHIVAYAIMSAAANEAHLLNICVYPQWQGNGIGRELLERMMDIAADNQVDTVFLEVRPSNIVAVGLYENSGFNVIGTRKDYYPAENGREDAIIFARTIFR